MTQHHYSREKSKADQVVGFSYIDVGTTVKGLGDGVADDNVTKVDIPTNATGAILYVEIASGELRVSDNGGVPSSTDKRGRPVTKTGTIIYLGVSSTYKGSIAGLENCKMICSAGTTARVQVTYVRNVDR